MYFSRTTSYISSQLFRIQEGERKKIARMLIIALVFSAGVYLYVIGSTTMYVSERVSLQQEIRSAHSRIADLEAEFFALGDYVKSDQLHDLGYREAVDIVYAERYERPEAVAVVSQ